MTQIRRLGLLVALVASVGLPLGCDWHLPGKPIRPAVEKIDSRADFDRMYFVNCLGCHGPEGNRGPARPLNDPLYLASIPMVTLESVIRDGHGLLMPGFKKSLSGGLDEMQIAALASGMKHFWGDPEKVPAAGDLPSYAQAKGSGDVDSGASTFATYCGACHGNDGSGLDEGAGSVVDNDYLLLVSDQALRSTVLFGRPDLGNKTMPGGCPSFLGPYKGQTDDVSLSSSQIDDVTAWLISNRTSISEEAAR
jgi:mono/diheme cytochrome c family protein